jgi:hypothetical protein
MEPAGILFVIPRQGIDGKVGATSQSTNTFVWKGAGIGYNGNLCSLRYNAVYQ